MVEWRRSIARLSASVPSRHTQFSVAFTTNIAESNFRYTQPMRCFAIIGIAAIASLTAFATPVRAEIEYPWCAQYGGGEMGGGRNCGFSTLEQCRATISGIGGFCQPNLFYPASASDTSQTKRKRQY